MQALCLSVDAVSDAHMCIHLLCRMRPNSSLFWRRHPKRSRHLVPVYKTQSHVNTLREYSFTIRSMRTAASSSLVSYLARLQRCCLAAILQSAARDTEWTANGKVWWFLNVMPQHGVLLLVLGNVRMSVCAVQCNRDYIQRVTPR